MRKIPNKDYERLVELIGEYNEARAEIHNLLDKIISEADAYSNTRSDRWHESEAGDNYSDWVNSLNEVLDELSYELDIPPQKP